MGDRQDDGIRRRGIVSDGEGGGGQENALNADDLVVERGNPPLRHQGQQQQGQQQAPIFAGSAAYPGPEYPFANPLPHGQAHMLQFYESQMRDHAAAYASAAAGAAWAAAQIAADMANASSAMAQNGNFAPAMVPRALPIPPAFSYGHPPLPPPGPGHPMEHIPSFPHNVDPDMAHAQYSQDSDFAASSLAGYHGHHRRRKRQQRMSPSGSSNPGSRKGQQERAIQRQDDGSEKRGRRRRFPLDVGSSSDHGGSDHSSYSGRGNSSKRRARVRKSMTSSNSSDGGNSASYSSKKKKARQPNVDSLLGKTGISALHEWCDKRRMTTPTFSLAHFEPPGSSDAAEIDERKGPKEFEMVVSIDGTEWGRGIARTKIAAKQEAARKALQALIPGTKFDESTGILIDLPTTDSGTRVPRKVPSSAEAPWKASTSLEDLAPNLAKRLAIAPKEDSKPTAKNALSKKRPSKWNSECTSTTTSEEEDEDAYYASRGASICSSLLHAMVQIDDRIPEGPNYSYDIPSRNIATSTDRFEMRNDGSPILVHRGPFTCTATMRLQQPIQEEKSTLRYDILKAVAVGGAKREAKHMASAKLLALLFPECEGMAQVKEAAEAARERYAASKALKHQETLRSRQKNNRVTCQENYSSDSLHFALGSSNKFPELPREIETLLLQGLSGRSQGESISNDELHSCSLERRARQLSRQNQWEERICSVLQTLNDHDDEGRSLPEDELLTVDDVVGRTILRRATVDDKGWIYRLIGRSDALDITVCSILGENSEDNSVEEGARKRIVADVGCATSSVILLLCRAIAPYDDPPLGCAVLSLGFSLEKGRTLHASHIGSKSHLPEERFVECLQAFASCMNCTLASEKKGSTAPKQKKPLDLVIGQNDIQRIIHSHLCDPTDTNLFERESNWSTTKFPSDSTGRLLLDGDSSSFAQVTSPLQSVQEESEGVDESGTESGTEKRVVGRTNKEQDKPSKRSRVN